MPEQNFKNHSRYVPLYHFIAFPLVGFPLVSSIIHFIRCLSQGYDRVHAAAIVSLILGVALALWFSRSFALKAQDRAIRAEENFRHYLATGKPFDSRIRMGQIIALRFAGDNEFVALAKRAVDENLSAKQIKMAITNWRADNNRM